MSSHACYFFVVLCEEEAGPWRVREDGWTVGLSGESNVGKSEGSYFERTRTLTPLSKSEWEWEWECFERERREKRGNGLKTNPCEPP
jgi:hypothetical protein